MAARKNKAKSKKIKQSKTGLPILDSDQDFLKAFGSDSSRDSASKKMPERSDNDVLKNGVDSKDDDPGETEDFAALLEEYSQKSNQKFTPGVKKVPLKKRLKRYPKAEQTLDLHGFTEIPARIKLQSFIHTCKNRGFYTVRIIVGKGLHSSDGPVLPEMAEDEIRQLQGQGVVLWYEWENKRKNDSGAIIVYLKQFERYGD